MLIDKAIKEDILSRIRQAETQHNVRVLFAVESGSRAWGFASPNSDYDVRFIYVHPKDWYLAVDLEDKKDVIEYPIVDEIDINGWDLRKALKLFAKSNPTFIEWIYSPIIYVDDRLFAKTARSIVNPIYSIEKGIYHYRSMANTNYRGYLKKDQVPLKKYFYVLRPLLAILWLEKYNQPATIEFDKLRILIANNKPLHQAIEKLLQLKKVSLEKEMITAIPVIHHFIEEQLERLENYAEKPKKHPSHMHLLNNLFHQFLQ